MRTLLVSLPLAALLTQAAPRCGASDCALAPPPPVAAAEALPERYEMVYISTPHAETLRAGEDVELVLADGALEGRIVGVDGELLLVDLPREAADLARASAQVVVRAR